MINKTYDGMYCTKYGHITENPGNGKTIPDGTPCLCGKTTYENKYTLAEATPILGGASKEGGDAA